MLTALMLLTAIKTSEWHRYDGTDTPGFINAGTTGPDAIDLRVADPPWNHTDAPMAIEYKHVAADEWLPTGYAGQVRYDSTRDATDDGDGYTFYPYEIYGLALTTHA